MQSCNNRTVYGVIYKIENTINNKVYIGQTKKSFNDRYKSKGKGIERVYRYLKKSKEQSRYYNRYLLRSLEKYGLDNFRVIENLDFAFSKDELNKKEIEYIKYFDSFHSGYNLTRGGEGVVGVTGSRNGMYGVSRTGEDNPNSKRVICLNNKKIFDTAKKASEFYSISESSISQCCSGVSKSIRIVGIGKTSWMHYKDFLKLSEDEVNKRIEDSVNTKRIICLNSKEVFNSTKEASLKLKVTESNIYRACIKERKTAGTLNGEKLRWEYYDNYLKNIAKNPKHYNIVEGNKEKGKTVVCVTTGETFSSAKEAGRAYSIDSSSIAKCCKEKIKTSGRLDDGRRLVWKYAI